MVEVVAQCGQSPTADGGDSMASWLNIVQSYVVVWRCIPKNV